MTSHVLVFLIDHDGQLPLARKRRGLGAGRLVAPGGKVEPGETPAQAAVRELWEETTLRVDEADLEDAGSVRFRFDESAERMDVALFRADRWTGEPVATDELDAPAWYADLPLIDIWADNPHWLPALLAGEHIDVTITYDEAAEEILSVEPARRFACALLVDPRGWVLLQERDSHARIAPLKWGMVGGHVEESESFEEAVYRELAEETGLEWTGGLSLWREEAFTDPVNGRTDLYSMWTAGVDLTDADIVYGEGRQIVFVDPEVIPNLDLSHSARHFLLDFIGR